MPSNVFLSELTLKDGQLRVKGIVLQEGEDSKLTLTRFVVNLQDNISKDAHLISTKKTTDAGNKYEFEILANINKVK